MEQRYSIDMIVVSAGLSKMIPSRPPGWLIAPILGPERGIQQCASTVLHSLRSFRVSTLPFWINQKIRLHWVSVSRFKSWPVVLIARDVLFDHLGHFGLTWLNIKFWMRAKSRCMHKAYESKTCSSSWLLWTLFGFWKVFLFYLNIWMGSVLKDSCWPFPRKHLIHATSWTVHWRTNLSTDQVAYLFSL